jgi:hypothetical protein
MSVIKECYKYKTEMLGTEQKLNQMNTLYQQMLMKEKDNKKRKCLESISRKKKTYTKRNRFCH